MADRGGWWPEERDRSRSSAGEGADDGAPDPGDDGSDGTEPRPPRGLESRQRPRIASRYSLFVGLAFVALALVAVLNAISTEEGGPAGFDSDAERGRPLPEFALPQVPGPAVGADANIAQDDCESSRNPCPDDQVRLPACEIESPGAIRVCDLFERPLAISFWFTRGGDCLPSQDAFAEVAARRGGEANFLSVNVLDDVDRVVEIVEGRGWELPVGHDADGAVSNLLLVGVCPTIILAYPGGIVHAAEIKAGGFSASDIDALIDDLIRASARREPGARP